MLSDFKFADSRVLIKTSEINITITVRAPSDRLYFTFAELLPINVRTINNRSDTTAPIQTEWKIVQPMLYRNSSDICLLSISIVILKFFY